MSCANVLDNGQPCGDEGHVCDDCFQEAMREHAYLRHVPKYAVMPEDEAWRQDLIDAGRGHLVRP